MQPLITKPYFDSTLKIVRYAAIIHKVRHRVNYLYMKKKCLLKQNNKYLVIMPNHS